VSERLYGYRSPEDFILLPSFDICNESPQQAGRTGRPNHGVLYTIHLGVHGLTSCRKGPAVSPGDRAAHRYQFFSAIVSYRRLVSKAWPPASQPARLAGKSKPFSTDVYNYWVTRCCLVLPAVCLPRLGQ